uniref:Rx N-terminal domain-containing protein n=1 Tax=Aegilops tauschii TaxID=37682 RepID=M8D6Y4_AEGTA
MLFSSVGDDMERLNKTLGRSGMRDMTKPSPCFYFLSDSALYSEEQQFASSLQGRLNAAFAEVCNAVELADSHNLEDLEWLAYWAGTFREAKEQGCDVLGSIVNAKDNQEPIVGSEQEDELSSFVHRLEGLVRDVEYFKKLVDLCPAS